MIKVPEHNCINCSNFGWWDGDYCCVKHMKILQESHGGDFNDDILMSIVLNKGCRDWDENNNPQFLDLFNKFLKTKE